MKPLAMSFTSSRSVMSKCFSSIVGRTGRDRRITGWFSSLRKEVVPLDKSSIIGGASIHFVRASAVIDCVGTKDIQRTLPDMRASR